MKIYVASSWRNNHQPLVVHVLRESGHDVYDFRHPCPGNEGFHWSEIDPKWKEWGPAAFVKALEHPIAKRGLKLDESALRSADATVLVMPCGRSAHLELGAAIGFGQRTAVLLEVDNKPEPELMYGMAGLVTASLASVVNFLK